MLSCSVSAETNAAPPEASEFGGGYYVFFGLIAGFFVTVAIGLTLVVAAPAFTGGEQEAAPPPETSETTAPSTAAGDPVAGEQVYSSTCAACHGPSAEGVTGLGPALTGNEFVATLSDDELVTFLEEGRPADHPDNTSGIAMPPKGGNPSLTDQDLYDVVAYLRTLNP